MGGTVNVGGQGMTSPGGSYSLQFGGATIGALASWTGSVAAIFNGTNGATRWSADATQTVVFGSSQSGTGAVIKIGAGELHWSGVNSGYIGPFTVSNGTFVIHYQLQRRGERWPAAPPCAAPGWSRPM
jgi:autotransporter-associated beta strand protein